MSKMFDSSKFAWDAVERGPAGLSADEIALKLRSEIGPQGKVLSATFGGYASDGSARYYCKVLVDESMRVWVDARGRVTSKF